MASWAQLQSGKHKWHPHNMYVILLRSHRRSADPFCYSEYGNDGTVEWVPQGEGGIFHWV